jgi:Tfp pilus assembly protein PilV
MRYVKNQKGWLIVDALLAMVVLSVALAGIMISYTQISKHTQATKNYNQAVMIARQAVENSRQYNNERPGDPTAGFTPPQIKDGLDDIIEKINENNAKTENKKFTLACRYDGLKIDDSAIKGATITDTTAAKLLPAKFIVTWDEPAFKKGNVIPKRTIEIIDYYYTK